MRFLFFVKCFLLDNVTCVSVWSPLDGFIGCIMLYFCLLTEGEQWIIAIIKKSLQVSFLLSSSLLLHPIPCMSSCLLSPKMSKSWDKSFFWGSLYQPVLWFTVGWIAEPNMCTLRHMEIPQPGEIQAMITSWLFWYSAATSEWTTAQGSSAAQGEMALFT